MSNENLIPRNLQQVVVRHAVGAAVLLSCSVATYAQSAAAASASAASSVEKNDASGDTLTTVVISAMRRREPAREVPLQVDVVSSKELQDAGAKTLVDYMSNEPGVNVKTNGGSGGDSVTIRGVSAGDEVAPLVGVYVDDVAVGSSSAWVAGSRNGFDMSLLDLNHIEVLKGPQGTLYGASSMGGLLKYVTNTPDTYDFGGSLSVGASKIKGGGWGNTVSGVVNVPIKEGVAAVRISGFNDDAPGYVDDVGAAPRNEANRGTSRGLRASALIEPSSKFSLKLTAMTETIHRDGLDWVAYNGATNQPIKGPYIGQQDLQQPYETTTTLVSADLEYDFGWARLNSITSTQLRKAASVLDAGGYAALLPGMGIETVPFANELRLRRSTQEFRLTSPAGHEFEWIAGAYYNHESGLNLQDIDTTVAGGAPGPTLATATIPSTFEESAVYGDVTWNPMKRLSLTAGMRVARSTQKLEVADDGLLVGGSNEVDNKSAETARTYLATARYALTTYSNVYVRAASGYRPGGPNTPIYDTTGKLLIPATYQHDSLWSYEAGYKADLLDKALSLSTSVFDIRWKDIQQYGFVNSLSYLTNAGKAEVKGAELAATLVPVRDWKVSAALTWSDGKTTEDSPVAASGVPLPNSAKLSASLGVNYAFEVAALPSYVGFSERYVGMRHAGFEGSSVSPDLRLPAYAITDLQAGVDFKRVQLAFFVRNVFNRHAELGASSQQLSLGGPWLVNVQQPATAGITLTAPF